MMRIDSRLVRVVSCALAWALVAGSVQLPPSIAVAETVPPPATPAEPTVVRELTEARSETSREFLLSNGVVRGEYHSSPIHYRDATSGRFEPIDPTLVDAVIDGRDVSVNRAHSMRIVLPRRLDSRGVTVERGGRAVHIAPAHDVRCDEATPSADPVSMRSVSATERAYAAVFDGATLDYESRNSGLKESIVLPRAPKAASWAFDLTLEGLAPQSASDGSILLRDATGTPVFRIPRPWMLDSSSVTPGGVYSDAVRYELAGAGSSWRLVVVADAAWLADPARVYPVMIDPTVELVTGTGAGADDTYISSASKSTNYVSHTLIWLNNGDPAANWTEYIYLQPASAAYTSLGAKRAAGRAVVGARLKTYVTSAYFAHGGTYAGRMCVTSTAVLLGGITFNTYLQSPPMPQSTLTFAAPARTLVSGLYNTLDITAMTRHWQDMQAIPLARNKCTIQVFGGSNAHVGFNSGDNSTRQPIWEIDYAPIPIVALSTPPTSTPVLTSVPDAAWTYTEALGNPQTAFEVAVATAATDSAVATTIAGTGSATSCTLRLPSGPFTPGQTYHVKVRAASSPSVGVPALWSTWSPWGSFTLAPDAVGTPSVTTTASPGWFVEADVNGDGRNDALNDSNAGGRGSVTMTWTAAAGADGYAVELWDGAFWREVATTTATSWTSAGAGIFPTDSAIASMSVADTSSPFLPGTGLDLRDDLRGLYAARGSLLPTTSPACRLRVRSRLGSWTRPGEDAGAREVEFTGRTRHVFDDPRHTIHPLGTIAGHEAAFGLDTSEITLDACDLAVASWGPEVSVARHYSSDATAPGLLGRGWRFGFEESLAVSATTAAWTDPTGQVRTFVRVGAGWAAPTGCFDALEATTAPTGAAHAIRHKGGAVTVFDTAGRLLSRSDRAGNTASYTWSGEDLTITAANGQTLAVDVTAGRMVSAVWSTSAGTRRVEYASADESASVTRFPGTSVASTTTYEYADGRLTSLRGPTAGSEWAFACGSDGSTMAVECASPTSSQLRRSVSIDASAHTATISAFDGATSYAWDPTGATVSRSAEGSSGLDTAISNSVDGLPIREVGPTGLVTSCVHDGRGDVTSEIDAAGRAASYVHDATGDCVVSTDVRGARTWRTFDAAGNVTIEDRELTTAGVVSHRVDTYAYDGVGPKGRLTDSAVRISDAETATTTFADFDPVSGQAGATTIHDVVLAAGTVAVDLTSRCSFDAFGQVLSETDAAGVVTLTNVYDLAGRVGESRDATGAVTRTVLDAAGDVVATWRSHPSTDALLSYMTTERNGAGLVTTETMRASDGGTVSTVTHVYDALGREVRRDDSAVPGAAVTVFDAQGNVVRSTQEGAGPTDASSTRTSFDALSRPTKVLDPGAVSAATTTTYTGDGQVASQHAPDGSVTANGYNDVGDLTSESVPSDEGTATTSHVYDLGGNKTASTGPDGSTTTMCYDLTGRVTGTRVGTRPVSTISYNTAGWVIAQTDFDGIVRTKAYDACGRVTEDTIAGMSTTHVFDALGNEVSTTNPDGSTISSAFDAFGRLVRRVETASGGTVAHDLRIAFDAAGRTARVEDTSMGLTRTFAYADDGGVTTSEERGARQVTTVADGTGLVRSITATIAGTPIDFSVVGTDTASRVTGWASQAFATTATLAYDEAGRVYLQDGIAQTSDPLAPPPNPYANSFPPGSQDGVSPYRYSPVTGRKDAETFRFAYANAWGFAEATETAEYRYTIEGRLASASRNASSVAYWYEADTGALAGYKRSGVATVALSYETNTGRIASAGPRTFSHDAAGRRVNAGTAADSRETTYTWSGERLVGMSVTASVAASHAYDASGQRVRSVVREGSLVTTTSWSWEGIALAGLEASSSDGATWSIEYVRDGEGRLMAGVYRDAVFGVLPFRIVTTDRGDVRELIDRTGVPLAFYAYDAYGNPVVTASAPLGYIDGPSEADFARFAARQPLRYAGYVWDAHSRLYYCSQRYYDPSVAAFISKDPARADGEESAYQYCGGDPVGKVDPSGEWCYYRRICTRLSAERAGRLNLLMKCGKLTEGLLLVVAGAVLGQLTEGVGTVVGVGGAVANFFSGPSEFRTNDVLSYQTSSIAWYRGDAWMNACHSSPQTAHYYYYQLNLCSSGAFQRRLSKGSGNIRCPRTGPLWRRDVAWPKRETIWRVS